MFGSPSAATAQHILDVWVMVCVTREEWELYYRARSGLFFFRAFRGHTLRARIKVAARARLRVALWSIILRAAVIGRKQRISRASAR